MTAREVLKRMKQAGVVVVRQRGSHIRVQYGECYSTVADHGADDIPAGTLRAIERDLEPCLGKGWLKRGR